MDHRRLGRSGLQVSEIAYGTWVTHNFDPDTLIACVRAALDLGITTFDSADEYAGGRAEEALGRALEHERREGLVISTKAYWRTGTGANDIGLSRKHLRHALDGSLRRLRTDYVDIYHAHRFDLSTPLTEVMSAYADLVRAGKVRYVGVSEWTAAQIRAAADLAGGLRVPLVSSQPQYSMLWRVIEAEIIPTCDELGLGQLVWSPLAQGVLSGKYRPAQPRTPGSRAADERASGGLMRQFLTDDVLDRVQRLEPLAAKAGLSLAQLAVAWVLHNRSVAAAIVGASRPEQLADPVRAAGTRLDDDLVAAVDEIIVPVAVTDPTRTLSAPRRP